MKLKSSLLPFLFLAGALSLADQTRLRAELQSIGRRQTAPEFRLTDSFGKIASLSAYRGKVVLLDFWATWCGGCKEEIPSFVEISKKYENRGLAVVGVSLDEDGWKVLKPFLATHPIAYRIVLGNDAVSKEYAIESMPDTFLIDQQGRVAAAYRGGIVDMNNIQANIEKLLVAQ